MGLFLMDTYIVRSTCHECGKDVELILSDLKRRLNCPDCDAVVIKAQKAKGYIYVISNPRFDGVKIGMTEKSVEARVKSLRTAGVPMKPKIEGYFISHNVQQDEKKAHEKLRRYHLEREHFSIDAVTALIRLANTFGREPMYMRPAILSAYSEQREKNFVEAAAKGLIEGRRDMLCLE